MDTSAGNVSFGAEAYSRNSCLTCSCMSHKKMVESLLKKLKSSDFESRCS